MSVSRAAKVILIRHGQSTWNLKHIWTGWENPPLSERGVEEAVKAGQIMGGHNVHVDLAFASDLLRAQETGVLCLRALGQEDVPWIIDPAIKERDYGQLTRMDKTQVQEEQPAKFAARRSYQAHPGPGWVAGVFRRGESLEEVFMRAWPYYLGHIQPAVTANGGQTVAVFGHGNSFRAIVMGLHGLTPEEIERVEIPWAQPIVYELGSSSGGRVSQSYILAEGNQQLQVDGHWLGVSQEKQ